MITVEVTEQTKGEALPKGRGTRWKTLVPVLVMTLRTKRMIPLFDLSEQDGSDGASNELQQFRWHKHII